ncbi:MAG: hypothetical protein R3A52_25960 [Polyangiales bacterium]
MVSARHVLATSLALLASLASCTGTLTETVDDAGSDVSLPALPGCGGQGRSRCVASVSIGDGFGCAALGDGTAWCWGRNDESQLGYESSDLCPERLSGGQTRAVACHAYPLQVSGLSGVTSLSAGGAHACAVLRTGEALCWGGNTRGQLGNASTLPSRAPALVAGLRGVAMVAAGARHTCAVTHERRVYCWGANDRGQLGVETSPHACGSSAASEPCARAPVLVPFLSEVVEVVAGDAHTCARGAGGQVWCWGTNVDGQLGAGTAGEEPSPTPRPVRLGASMLRGVVALAAGGEHTCATRDDGAVLCWGRHDRGQLGVAVPERFEPCAHACVTSAVPIVGFEGDASADDDASVGDAATDDIDAAVDDDVPRGDAGRDAAEAAVDVGVDNGLPPAPTAVAVSAGGAFSCLALSDRTVRCWGTNRAYELGSGRVNEGGATMQTVIASPGSAATNPLQGVSGVASGASTTCAVLTDRSVRCWGSNELGALGVGDLSERNGPVAMTW